MRAARLAVAIAVAAACPAPFAAAAPCARYAREAWVTVNAPAFPAGPPAITDYVVAGRDPDRVYVTNGAVVLASADGGCTWRTALTQLDAPVLGAMPRITHLATSATDPDLVYAATGSDVASRPGVLRTTDGGKTWAAADRGLEAIQGRPLQLVVAPSRGEVAYLVVEGNRASQGDYSAEVARSLYVTDDGGTWEERRASPLLVGGVTQRVGPVQVSGNGSFEGVAVDPRNSELVWLYGGFGLWVSKDAARTSARMVSGLEAEEGGPVGHVDLYHSLDVNRVAAFGSRADQAWLSFSGAAPWYRAPTPGIVRSSASGRRHTELAIATDTQVLYQQSGDSPPRQITPRGPSVRDLSVSFGNTPVFYARTTAALLRWTAPVDAPLPGDVPRVDVPDDPTKAVIPQLPPLATPTLRGPREVTVEAGSRETVPYTLDLPGVQRADVYFLVDVSDSMEQEINGLRSALAGIVTDLVVSRIDAHFGVARFNTYDSEPYFRVTPVVPPGEQLALALMQLDASEGGTQKSHLEGLLQSVTGAGASSDDVGSLLDPRTPYSVPPGQGAGFRPEAPVKLILNITDEAFYEDAPSPSYEAVGTALRRAGVRQIGLALDNEDVLPSTGPGPEVGLARVARDSGALAPDGGVDCDGDGGADIETGEPLVCVMPSGRSHEATVLANAIVNLVRSIPNRGSVDLAVTPDRGAPRARLNRTSFDVEFERTVRRSVEVTFACPPAAEPATHSYDVRATSAGAPLAATTTTVRCVPRTTGPPPAVRGALPAVVVGAVAPAPQPPTSNGNPNPNVNPNPQSQPQAQGQLGSVTEPEEQDQFQVAAVDVRDTDVEELAMTRRAEVVPVPAWLAAAGLLSAAAYGLGLRGAARGAARGASRPAPARPPGRPGRR